MFVACEVTFPLSSAVCTLCSIVSKQRFTRNFSVSYQQLSNTGNMRTGIEITSPCIVIQLNTNIELVAKLLSFEKNRYTLGIFVDLAKAFDTVNYQILLKLYGVIGNNCSWVENYPSNRKQCVAIKSNENTSTAWKVTKYRVFSWSVLSVFGLNAEIYPVNVRIQSEYGKIRNRKNSVFGYFLHGGHFRISYVAFPNGLFSIRYY